MGISRDAVDREGRRKMAMLMRRFAAGRIEVDEFESAYEELPDTDDAIRQAFYFAWYHYDDFDTTYLTGKWALSRTERRAWARWVLYLMTDAEPYQSNDFSPNMWSCLVIGSLHLIACALGTINYRFFVSWAGICLVFPSVLLCLASMRKAPVVEETYGCIPFASDAALARAVAIKNPFAYR